MRRGRGSVHITQVAGRAPSRTHGKARLPGQHQLGERPCPVLATSTPGAEAPRSSSFSALDSKSAGSQNCNQNSGYMPPQPFLALEGSCQRTTGSQGGRGCGVCLWPSAQLFACPALCPMPSYCMRSLTWNCVPSARPMPHFIDVNLRLRQIHPAMST